MPTLAEQLIPARKLLLIAAELVILAGILLVGTGLPPLASHPFAWSPTDLELWRAIGSSALVALLCQASFSYNDLYDWKVSQNRRELPNRLLHSAGYSLVMLSVAVWVAPWLFHFPGLQDGGYQTWKLILLFAIGHLVIYTWRFAFHWFFYKWNFAERVVVLGAGIQGQSIATMIQDHPVAGFEVAGLVTADGRATGDTSPLRVLGELPDLLRIVGEQRAARVVVALEERRGRLRVDELLQCRLAGIQVEEREVMYERIAGKIAIESLRPSYLVFSRGFERRRLALAVKRVLDVVCAGAGLVLSAPISALAILAIKLDSSGPVFLRQRRVGQHGAEFDVFKFRTMRADAERQTGPVWARVDDDRVTRVGRFLRLSRIDEIPQMWNVLRGQMSFVGPRPERPFFVAELTKEIPFYPLRLAVKPGITGWAQVNHHYGASVDDSIEKLRYDLYYIKNMSPLFDLNIILRTVGVVLFGKGAR
jgi:sugar transferase (PEP-CTERM system associated)